MGAVIAESLSAPLDYFLPVRVLEIVKKYFLLPPASVIFKHPTAQEYSLFAGPPSVRTIGVEKERLFPLGTVYQLKTHGAEGPATSLSYLCASIGSRMDASRPSLYSHSSPKVLPVSLLAESALSRYRDSQARYATLSVLDTESYIRRLGLAYPLINMECLREDILRVLASFFEAAGGLYLSEEGGVIALACASVPTDTELLLLQLRKSLRRFVTSSVDPSVDILRSRLFESPEAESMKAFLANASSENAS